MTSVITPSQCPIAHATSALDSIEYGISLVLEIASMVDGIHALAELPMDGATLAQLKKRVTSIGRLGLLTVQFVEERGKVFSEIRDQAEDIVEELNLSLSECWVPVHPDMMPPDDVIVIAWDSVGNEPSAARYDAEGKCWYEQSDGAKFFECAITHWRYCHAPDGAGTEGVAS